MYMLYFLLSRLTLVTWTVLHPTIYLSALLSHSASTRWWRCVDWGLGIGRCISLETEFNFLIKYIIVKKGWGDKMKTMRRGEVERRWSELPGERQQSIDDQRVHCNWWRQQIETNGTVRLLLLLPVPSVVGVNIVEREQTWKQKAFRKRAKYK